MLRRSNARGIVRISLLHPNPQGLDSARLARAFFLRRVLIALLIVDLNLPALQGGHSFTLTNGSASNIGL